MTSKTDSNNLASAVTETFITQAERIIRSHDDFCIGYYETTEPWCAAAPVGTPLCRGCRALADKITKALRTLHQERDEAIAERDETQGEFHHLNETASAATWAAIDRAEAAEAENQTLKANEHDAIQRLSIMLTGGNAATWDEIFDAVAALTASPHRKDT